MLLQTNSYIVPKDRRAEHSRLIRRFRQTLLRLGCDHFEVYEQVGSNWSNTESTGRYVQIMRFRDRKHQLAVQQAERADSTAQAVIQEFCDLINFPYQQQQGLFAVGFYISVLPVTPLRSPELAPSVAAVQRGEEADYPPTGANAATGRATLTSMTAGEQLLDDVDAAVDPDADWAGEDDQPAHSGAPTPMYQAIDLEVDDDTPASGQPAGEPVDELAEPLEDVAENVEELDEVSADNARQERR